MAKAKKQPLDALHRIHPRTAKQIAQLLQCSVGDAKRAMAALVKAEKAQQVTIPERGHCWVRIGA